MRKLFFIDDEKYCCLVAEKILSQGSINYDVLYSNNGFTVIEFLKKNKQVEQALPDFIFVDLSMPVFSGWDFLEAYQSIYISLKKAIHIYVVSSSVNADYVKKAQSYPFVEAFIPKPLTKSVLENALQLISL
jgi:CheY-like chemotaxis protein